MAKKLMTVVKLQIVAGKANPAPPIGPALGQHGVAIPVFCQQFNAKTAAMGDAVVPVEISIFEDRTFTFIMKTPPASYLILKALNQQKGSGEPNKTKIGKITKSQLREIAEKKMPDLNCHDVEAGMKIIAGTARNMGVEVEA
ncbi:50S ribosomal protein L11 [Candidatus Peregrinibacteria bacterium]|nr:50S ribosomal protein L11 [Candidatus Peregrinibacteria bacterium]